MGLERRLTLLWIVALLLGRGAQIALNQVAIARLPSPVLTAIEEKFPNANLSKVKTKKEAGGTIREMTVRQRGESFEVSVRPYGEIVKVERWIAAANLPTAVTTALDKAYPKSVIRKAEEVHQEDRLIGYEVAVELPSGPVADVTFSPAGEVIHRSPTRSKSGVGSLLGAVREPSLPCDDKRATGRGARSPARPACSIGPATPTSRDAGSISQNLSFANPDLNLLGV